MKVEAVSERKSNLGEGPHWDSSSLALWHVDAFVGDVCRLDPYTGLTETFQNDKLVTFVIPTSSNPNHVVYTYYRQFRKLNWTNRQWEFLGEIEPATNRFNDGKCDARGRLWAGSVLHDPTTNDIVPGGGKLYSLDPDGTIKEHVDNITLSNGITWTPDWKLMFFNDSEARIINVFNFDLERGSVSNRQTFVNFNERPTYINNGYPDGMTTDVEGKLWVACYAAGKVIRIDPETAHILQTVEIPATNVTSCCFGGPQMDELYVTTGNMDSNPDEMQKHPQAGSVFRVSELGVKGLPLMTFNG